MTPGNEPHDIISLVWPAILGIAGAVAVMVRILWTAYQKVLCQVRMDRKAEAVEIKEMNQHMIEALHRDSESRENLTREIEKILNNRSGGKND